MTANDIKSALAMLKAATEQNWRRIRSGDGLAFLQGACCLQDSA